MDAEFHYTNIEIKEMLSQDYVLNKINYFLIIIFTNSPTASPWAARFV